MTHLPISSQWTRENILELEDDAESHVPHHLKLHTATKRQSITAGGRKKSVRSPIYHSSAWNLVNLHTHTDPKTSQGTFINTGVSVHCFMSLERTIPLCMIFIIDYFQLLTYFIDMYIHTIQKFGASIFFFINRYFYYHCFNKKILSILLEYNKNNKKYLLSTILSDYNYFS